MADLRLALDSVGQELPSLLKLELTLLLVWCLVILINLLSLLITVLCLAETIMDPLVALVETFVTLYMLKAWKE